MIPFIDLKTQYKRISKGVADRIQVVLDHGQYINGPEIGELERVLASYVGVKHCIGLSSGTDALLVALMALGVEAGDEVIIPDFSFYATAEVVSLLGAKPVFVDVNPKDCNLDPGKFELAITAKTKAVIPVSLYGQCADLDLINQIASKKNIAVIEDGAQSFGATYKGRKSCGLSVIGCTSFFPSKPLGGYGDGGACFTNDDKLMSVMREIRDHGQAGRYFHVRVGLNARLDSLQAAVLLEKFEILDEELLQRRKVADYYSEALQEVVDIPFIYSHNESVYAQYTIQVEERDALQNYLREKGIPTAVHYPQPLSKQPVYNNLDQTSNQCEVALQLSGKVLSLPMHPYLEKKDQDQIIFQIKEWCSSGKV